MQKIEDFSSRFSGLGLLTGASRGENNIPGVPFLAEGGVVKKPTLAMIGESGPEAVVPLNKAGGMGGGLTVIVNGDVSGEELIEKIKSSLINELGENFKFNLETN